MNPGVTASRQSAVVLKNSPQRRSAETPLRELEWNSYEFIALGQPYIVRINGEAASVWTDPKQRTAAGHIGLKNYAEGKGAQHRRLRIKELP